MAQNYTNLKIKLIPPDELENISNLRKHEIAFPLIDFNYQQLSRNKTTLKAAYTNIINNDLKNYLSDLEWDRNGDIIWQNNMLEVLSEKISLMIDSWKKKNDDELLKKIFIFIQLWGGNTSRGFFNGSGFDKNYNHDYYFQGVNAAIEKNYSSLNKLLQLNQFGISFATKHLYFWSDKHLPIYDNIIAMIIFGRIPINSQNHYTQYVNSLEKVAKENNTFPNYIERSIFNWYETATGQRWFKIRKGALKK
jgi:hypothetical protein